MSFANCLRFKEHLWRKEICNECFQNRNDHSPEALERSSGGEPEIEEAQDLGPVLTRTRPLSVAVPRTVQKLHFKLNQDAPLVSPEDLLPRLAVDARCSSTNMSDRADKNSPNHSMAPQGGEPNQSPKQLTSKEGVTKSFNMSQSRVRSSTHFAPRSVKAPAIPLPLLPIKTTKSSNMNHAPSNVQSGNIPVLEVVTEIETETEKETGTETPKADIITEAGLSSEVVSSNVRRPLTLGRNCEIKETIFESPIEDMGDDYDYNDEVKDINDNNEANNVVLDYSKDCTEYIEKKDSEEVNMIVSVQHEEQDNLVGVPLEIALSRGYKQEIIDTPVIRDLCALLMPTKGCDPGLSFAIVTQSWSFDLQMETSDLLSHPYVHTLKLLSTTDLPSPGCIVRILAGSKEVDSVDPFIAKIASSIATSTAHVTNSKIPSPYQLLKSLDGRKLTLIEYVLSSGEIAVQLFPAVHLKGFALDTLCMGIAKDASCQTSDVKDTSGAALDVITGESLFFFGRMILPQSKLKYALVYQLSKQKMGFLPLDRLRIFRCSKHLAWYQLSCLNLNARIGTKISSSLVPNSSKTLL